MEYILLITIIILLFLLYRKSVTLIEFLANIYALLKDEDKKHLNLIDEDTKLSGESFYYIDVEYPVIGKAVILWLQQKLREVIKEYEDSISQKDTPDKKVIEKFSARIQILERKILLSVQANIKALNGEDIEKVRENFLKEDSCLGIAEMHWIRDIESGVIKDAVENREKYLGNFK